MKWTRLLAPFALAALAFLPVASAELTPKQSAAAEAALRDFTAAEFQTRQHAVDTLIALGPDVIPLVRKTLAGTKDNEVKMRCEMVLKGIAARWGIVVNLENPAAPIIVNVGPSRVTLTARDMPLAAVVDGLAEQSGNKPLVVPKEIKDRPVTLVVKDRPYWEAVDELCKSSGLMLGWHPQGASMLLEREGPRDPGAIAGPVVVKFDTVSLGRSFRTATSPRYPPNDTVAYSLSVCWEDRLSKASISLRFTKAILPGGRDLLQGKAQVDSWLVVRPGVRGWDHGPAHIEFEQVPEGARKFDTIEGFVRVARRVDAIVLRLEDVLGKGERPVSARGITLMLKKDPERVEGTVALTVAVKRDGGDPGNPLATESRGAGFALVDPKGVRHPGVVKVGRFSTEDAGNQDKPGQDKAAEEAEFDLGFSNLPDIEGPWSLVLTWPRRPETREYPFAIKDVPMP